VAKKLNGNLLLWSALGTFARGVAVDEPPIFNKSATCGKKIKSNVHTTQSIPITTYCGRGQSLD
jgi:hypothetical protein